MQRSRLADWIGAGHLTPAARRALDAHVDPWPTAPDWRAALNVGLLWLAVLLVSTGVIMFIAANWARAGNLPKIGGVEALMLLCAGLAQWQRRRANVRNAALLVGAFATGGLLALVGQIYQTGADTAVLFGAWALSMLPWALACTTPILWLLWAAVLSLATGLALADAYLPIPIDPFLAVAALNLMLLAAWEVLARRIPWLATRLGPRCLAALAITMLSAHAIGVHALFRVGAAVLPAWLLWAIALAALGAVQYRKRQDPMILAFIALSVLVVVTWLGSSAMFDRDFMLGLVGGAALAIGQAAAYTRALRVLTRGWQS